MGRVVGITGTPGTGKKSIAGLVATSLGVSAIDLGAFALSGGVGRGSGDVVEVDTGKLKRMLAAARLGECVLYGHLLPYSLPRALASKVAVLRTEPSVLKGRLIARGYPPKKVVDDVEAELIGLISSDSYKEFGRGKAFEVDTTYSSPAGAARAVVSAVRGPPTRGGIIDWTVNYDSGPRLRSLLSVG